LAVNGPMGQEEFDALPLPEKYIISKCHTLVGSVTQDLEKYQLGAAGSKVRSCYDMQQNVWMRYYTLIHIISS